MGSDSVNLNPQLAAALVKFQMDVPVIPKNRTAKIKTKSGSDYSYKFADLADIWSAIRKPLSDNGLAVTQQLSSDQGHDYIVTKIWCISGETSSERFRIPTEGKAPQEVGSVITYYKRYTLGAALGISTEEDDDGAAGNIAPVSKSVIAPPEDQLTRAKRAINESLETSGYSAAVQKKAFVTRVLGHSTIDTLDEADLVMDAIENEAI